MNKYELRATRHTLGLTMQEVADIAPKKVSAQMIKFAEMGERKLPEATAQWLDEYAVQYSLLIDLISQDCEKYMSSQPYPENADDFPLPQRPTMPLWADFEQFKIDTGNDNIYFWRVYQAAVAHLYLMGKFKHLDDSSPLPKSFVKTWNWLRFYYDKE